MADDAELLAIEADMVNVIADMAAAAARYHVVVTLTFVPPDPEPAEPDG